MWTAIAGAMSHPPTTTTIQMNIGLTDIKAYRLAQEQSNLVSAFINPDPYITKVKTDVVYDDIITGVNRWGSIERYREELLKTENSMSKCGVEHVLFTCPDIECEGYGEVTELEYTCLNPFCEKCRPKIAWRKTKVLSDILKSYIKPRIFEVGWQGHHELNIKNIRAFRKDLIKLISYLRKKGMVNKWFYVIEFAYHKDGFNIHAHVVYDGRYTDQKLLSNQWLKVTGNSYIAHIQLVKNHKRAVNDMAKYLSKPFKGVSLARWVAVMKHTRMFSMSKNSSHRKLFEDTMNEESPDPSSLVTRRNISPIYRLKCRHCGLTLVPVGKVEPKEELDCKPPPDLHKNQRLLADFDSC